MTEQDKVPPLGSVLETGLYVEDLGRARHFYEAVLGLLTSPRDAAGTSATSAPRGGGGRRWWWRPRTARRPNGCARR